MPLEISTSSQKELNSPGQHAICTQCRRVFEQLRSFKTCPTCREKGRINNRMARQRKDERLKELIKNQFGTRELSSDKIVDENDRHGSGIGASSSPAVVPNTATAISAGMKRKAPKAFNEMEEEERREALSVMMNGLKHSVKGNKRVANPMRITNTMGEAIEYQTATALYGSLKSCVTEASAKGKKLQFQGFHAIIANSMIDNQKRVELVSTDLRKIVRVQFDHRNPKASYDFQTMGRIYTYTCRCLGNTTLPATNQVTMKGTQGDLIRQARLAQATTASPSVVTVPRVCGGKVKITAVDDGRHPLGILAQRISISINH